MLPLKSCDAALQHTWVKTHLVPFSPIWQPRGTLFARRETDGSPWFVNEQSFQTHTISWLWLRCRLTFTCKLDKMDSCKQKAVSCLLISVLLCVCVSLSLCHCLSPIGWSMRMRWSSGETKQRSSEKVSNRLTHCTLQAEWGNAAGFQNVVHQRPLWAHFMCLCFDSFIFFRWISHKPALLVDLSEFAAKFYRCQFDWPM